jgi:hypothetical protein
MVVSGKTVGLTIICFFELFSVIECYFLTYTAYPSGVD